MKPKRVVYDAAFEKKFERIQIMRTVKYTYWKDGEFFIGFLNEYPDYQTQGMSKEELMENLKDLLVDLESGKIPYIRKVEELSVA